MANYLIDTETTGLSSKDEVIQLAWIKLPETLLSIKELSLKSLLALPTSVEFFNPSVPIQIEAQKVHGLSKLKLLKYPRSNTCKLPDDCTLVVGHNVSFDIRMLKTSVPASICTKELSIQKKLVANKLVKDNKLLTLFDYYYPKQTNKLLHEQFAPHFHDALNDCFKTLLILKELL